MLVAILYLAIALAGVTVYPLVFADEVTLNEPAKELALFGHWRSEYFSVSYSSQQFDHHFYWQPPGQGIVTAASYRLLGFGIWQTRLPGIVAAAGCIVLFAVIASEALGRRAALPAALLLAIHPQFFRSSINARMDTECWLGLLWALFIILRIQRTNPAKPTGYFFAGVWVGVAGIFHPLAISWAIAFNGLFVVQRVGWPAWIRFNAGCALAPVAWIAWAAPHFNIWVAQFVHHGASRLAAGGPIERIVEEISRTIESHAAAPCYLVFTVLMAGVAFANWRKLPSPVKSCAILSIGVAGFVILVMGKGAGEYNAYYFLLLLIPALAGFHLGIDQGPKSRRLLQAAVYGVVIPWSVLRLTLPIAVARFAQAPARDYGALEAQLRPMLKAGDVVFGAPETWYAVVRAGAKLHEPVGMADAATDDVAILPPEESFRAGKGFTLVGKVGQRLPPVLGHTFSSNDYQFFVWRSDRRDGERKS